MKLALFDFDETLIRENSLSYLFKETSNLRFLFPAALSLALDFDTYRHGIKRAIKRRLYKRCLAGVTESDIYQAGKNVAHKLHPLTEVADKLHQLAAQNHTVWVVTATPTLFVQGVVEQWGWPVAKVIGTELHLRDQVYTGEFSEECLAQEKVRRIQAMLSRDNLKSTIEVAYGNLPVDQPMMSLANKSYAVVGRKIITFH
ncbi:HAD-superfamily subfamily IB hydrolase, TIGR01490 [Nitrosomonas cryotolerans]|uniref:HAD-superfamily subfamily IB hydrolase, TIGR01490 n=1 Tax=Nitrosomonas cryotolerans ATCC 49181 TaxID=1131553 RepID=A0A1N6JJ73_9PROT|nr:HAD-IB family phosphatase [Nitrosomonas cryotolerans]SFP89362.1 HAD-superfamily subfamily IB hydrolase, TIGR01490 [Nitrosomonas cryotolerans]SIO44293.1 HAD-superfamily subfamily IB hydrolase, TIGR01490 [Nitrosomonas cryotolerans ATCC 49181]